MCDKAINNNDENTFSANTYTVNSTDGDVTLTAVYTNNTYTVQFDANGGSGTMADQAFTYDQAQTLMANTFTRALRACRAYFQFADEIGSEARDIRLDDNGASSKMLKALVASDFIQPYVPFGMSKHDEHYKLCDPFCLFYQKYVAGHTEIDAAFWMHNVTAQGINSWRGFAFEEVCMTHIRQIKQAINILDVSSTQSAWSLKGDDESEEGQIDLLINRKDNVVDMCEMKFYNETYNVSKAYHAKLIHRQNLLTGQLPKRASVHHVLITTFGLNYNEYSGIFQHVITIDQLF